MKSRQIHLFISNDLLKQVDEAALQNSSTRSRYIRESLVLRLKGEDTIEQEQADFLEKLKKLQQRV